jgi:hypothetical protein
MMGRPKKVIVEEPKKEAPKEPKKRVSRKTKMATGRPKTAATAIKLFCQECMGFQPKLVRGCTDHRCPLFDFRLAGIEPTEFSVRTKDG